MRRNRKRLALTLGWIALAAAGSPCAAEQKEFAKWPAGSSPAEIGKRVAERFVSSGHLRDNTIIYPEVCAWYGSLTFARLAGDKDLKARLIKRFDRLLTPAEFKFVPTERHVDFSVLASCPSSKAAVSHLIRELAIGLGPLVRVNGVAPATVVAGSSMFPRDRVIGSLRKYGIEFAELESTEALRDRLAAFYARRTITRLPILPSDCAHAICWLAGDGSAKTTGHVIPVDGGLPEAFLR